MAAIQTVPEYEYLGTYFHAPALTVSVAQKKESDQLLLVNRVSHSPQRQSLFRDLYASFTRKEEHSDFLELFSAGQDFYAVFRCNQGPSLAELYQNCSGVTARRMQILISALFQVCSAAADFPKAMICSVLQPDNLLLNEKKEVRLRYQLKPEFLAQDEQCDQWREVARLLEFMLEKELSSPYHKNIQVIYKKCCAGLYAVLPALILDLERALKTLGQSNPLAAAKRWLYHKKDQIAQISWLGMVTVFMFLIIYLVFELTNQEGKQPVPISEIGTITYVAAQEEDTDSMQLLDPAPAGNMDSQPAFSCLPDEADQLISEDYIVQPGDILAVLCERYYGNAFYDALVASFNGLTMEDTLEPGSVLRLPQKDQLAQYLESST